MPEPTVILVTANALAETSPTTDNVPPVVISPITAKLVNEPKLVING